MKVSTAGARVERSRRTILEMLASAVDLSEAPEIQKFIDEYHADRTRFPDAERREHPVLDDNPMYIRDYSKCILCWRCVQVCADDAQYTYAINFKGRGFDTGIGTFFDKPMPETTCVFCGQCVGVCPTGALKPKRESLLEQGFDLDEILQATRGGKRRRRKRHDHPDRIVSTTCPYCGVGCKLELHIKDDYIYKVTSPFDSRVNHGNLCVKGRFGYDFIYNPDRVTTPLIRKTPQTARRAHPGVRAIEWREGRGMRRSTTPPTGWWRFTGAMAPTRWPCTAAPRRPTKTTICCRRCSARCSAPTTSITARGCATPARWWRCKWRWAPRP